MATGDYILSKSTQPGDDFEVQTRYVPCCNGVSLNNGIAARVAGDVVNIFPNGAAYDLIINGNAFINTTTLNQTLPGGGAVQVASAQATISWPDRTMIIMVRGGAKLLLAPSRLGMVEGLLGNDDGDPTNDLRVRNGPVVNVADVYLDFKSSWRVTFGSIQSLFRRGPDPFDSRFPGTPLTLASFSAATVANARATCRNAGILHPEVIDSCAFDIAATGDNTWAAVAVQFDPLIPALTVTPALGYAIPGDTRQFAAAVTGLTSKAVVWSATAGSIVVTGENGMTYTAPATPGEYRITATSAQNGSVTSTATVIVNAAITGHTFLTTGGNFACALNPAGQAYCWGRNDDGELGNGTRTSSSVPVAVQQGGVSFTTLSTSYAEFACALTAAGQAYCWGNNNFGQLGTGSAGNTSPAPVAGGISFVQLVASNQYTCGLNFTGQAYCWGVSSRGALGNGATSNNATPMPVQQGALRFASLAASGDHTCGLTPAGQAYCWGDNSTGQLGNGATSTAANPNPVAVAQGALVFTSIGAGYSHRLSSAPFAEHTCALATSGQAYCWGENSEGELGSGSAVPGPVPAPVLGPSSSVPVVVQGGLTFTSITVGDEAACGVTASGQAYCWGFNYWGQLGNGTALFDFRANPVPTAVQQQPGLAFAIISAGNDFACAMTVAGQAYCWGLNDHGQLGDGTAANRTTPVPVAGGIAFRPLVFRRR